MGLSNHGLSYLSLSYLILSCLGLPYLTLSYLSLSYLSLSYLSLSYLASLVRPSLASQQLWEAVTREARSYRSVCHHDLMVSSDWLDYVSCPSLIGWIKLAALL